MFLEPRSYQPYTVGVVLLEQLTPTDIAIIRVCRGSATSSLSAKLVKTNSCFPCDPWKLSIGYTTADPLFAWTTLDLTGWFHSLMLSPLHTKSVVCQQVNCNNRYSSLQTDRQL